MQQPSAPWDAEDAFPLKPEGAEYGYAAGRRTQSCTQEQLIARFAGWHFTLPRLVWSPESPRLVPPAEISYLRAHQIERLARKVRRIYFLSGLILVLSGIGALLKPSSQRLFVLAYTALVTLVPLAWSHRRLAVLGALGPGRDLLITRNARFIAWLRGRRIAALWLLLGCLAAAGLIQAYVGVDRSIDAAGFDRPAIAVGEYWRLITGSFLHLDAGHFFWNFSYIALVGWGIEALTSRHQLPIVVFASCLAGGVASLPFYEVTVGASDVTFGFLAFLTMVSLLGRRHLPAGFWKWMVWLLAVEVTGEFFHRGEVNHAAHVGGFLAGAICGWVLLAGHQGALALKVTLPWKRVGRACAGLTFATTLGVVVAALSGHQGISGLYQRGYESHMDGDYVAAEDLFTRILEKAPGHADSLSSRASARWSLVKLEEALQDFDAYLEIEKESADGFMSRGALRAEMGDMAGSVSDLDRAVAIDSRHVSAFTWRAWTHLLRGDLVRAMNDADRALDLDPKDAYALCTRGQIRQAKGDLDGALADNSEAIRLDPDHEYAYVARGEAREAKGDLEGALADFERALEIDKGDLDARLGRGRVRKARGDPVGARSDLEAALTKAHRWWRRRAEAEAALREVTGP